MACSAGLDPERPAVTVCFAATKIHESLQPIVRRNSAKPTKSALTQPNQLFRFARFLSRVVARIEAPRKARQRYGRYPLDPENEPG